MVALGFLLKNEVLGVATEKAEEIQHAQKLGAQGQLDRAIDELRQLLDHSSNDANVYTAIGDLYLANKLVVEAIDAYSQAAGIFIRGGVALKAIAVYKKILKLDPNRGDIYIQLGDLNAERGLMSNAIADYLSGAKLYQKAGKGRDALEVYRKITTINPGNTSVRLRVADLCLRERLIDEAIEEYLHAGEEYERLHKRDDAHKLYEKILALSPNHAEAQRRLGIAAVPTEGVSEAAAVPPGTRLAGEAVEVAASETRRTEEPAAVNLGGTIEFSLEELEALSPPAPVVPPATGTRESLAEARRLLAAGDIAQAERMIRTLLLEDPERNEYKATLGLVYLKKGNAAIAYDILYPIAQTWVEEGRQQEALELADAFLAAEPDEPDFRALKAHVAGVPTGLPSAAETLEVVRLEEGVEAATPTLEMSPLEAVSAGEDHSGETAGTIEFNPEELVVESSVAPASPGETVPDTEPLPVAEVVIPAAEVSSEAEKPVELAGVLSEELHEGAPAVAAEVPQKRDGEFDAILQEFRKGIKEQLAEEDYETHYDLGIAYKEMGLLAEAIEEFQVAAQGPARFIDSSTMIAACYKDQGANQSAITCLERALADFRCTGPTVPYLKYDLALLYEEEGITDKAVALYSSIPTIRDAAERLAKLQGANGSAADESGREPTRHTESVQGAESRRHISYL